MDQEPTDHDAEEEQAAEGESEEKQVEEWDQHAEPPI